MQNLNEIITVLVVVLGFVFGPAFVEGLRHLSK